MARTGTEVRQTLRLLEHSVYAHDTLMYEQAVKELIAVGRALAVLKAYDDLKDELLAEALGKTKEQYADFIESRMAAAKAKAEDDFDLCFVSG